jgi:hypothetical protein
MPRGYTKLPDGRQVPSHSQEGRDYRASLGTSKPTPEAKTIKTDVDGEEAVIKFVPPPPSIGVPKMDPEQGPKSKGKKEEKADEVEDLKQLVAALFYGFAAVSGCPEYKFNESEAEAVAKPLSRIVTRNTRIRKVVQQVADPIAVLGAVAFPLMVKHAAAEKRKKTPVMHAPTEAPVTVAAVPHGPPPPPSRNGGMPVESILTRISEGS